MKIKEFHEYDVYENGDVYSHYKHRKLNGDIVHGYLQYTLYIDKKPIRVKAHRLVAMLFLDLPDNYKDLVVNHIDGNKLNNHYTNLEWCTTRENNYHARVNKLNDISMSNSKRWEDEEFRKRVSQHISEGQHKTECNVGENNGRFRYKIYDESGKEYTRQSLSQFLGLSQSYTDALIKKFTLGKTNPHFEKYHIYVQDTKNKVNRLSKATDNEKSVA